MAHKSLATRAEKALFRDHDVVVGDASFDRLYLFTADQPDAFTFWVQQPEVHRLIGLLMGGGTDDLQLKGGVMHATYSGYTWADIAEIKAQLEDLDALGGSLEEAFPIEQA